MSLITLIDGPAPRSRVGAIDNMSLGKQGQSAEHVDIDPDSSFA